MNSNGQNNPTLANLSGTAVAILVGAFSIFIGHWVWGVIFLLLAVFLAIITGRQ